MEDSTVEACHGTEFCRPQFIDRNSYEQWLALGRPDLYTTARERVDAILARPLQNPLADKILGQLEDVMHRADAALA